MQVVAGDPERTLPASGRSIFNVDAPDHIVVTVASARVGEGLLVRVQELAGGPVSARIVHPYGKNSIAMRCTALEDPLEPLAVRNGAVDVSVGGTRSSVSTCSQRRQHPEPC